MIRAKGRAPRCVQVIYSTTPLVAALVARACFAERIDRETAAAIFVGLLATLLVFSESWSTGGGCAADSPAGCQDVTFVGNVYAFGVRAGCHNTEVRTQGWSRIRNLAQKFD